MTFVVGGIRGFLFYFMLDIVVRYNSQWQLISLCSHNRNQVSRHNHFDCTCLPKDETSAMSLLQRHPKKPKQNLRLLDSDCGSVYIFPASCGEKKRTSYYRSCGSKIETQQKQIEEINACVGICEDLAPATFNFTYSRPKYNLYLFPNYL